MRALFAEVLVWHEPLEPAKLWAKWAGEMVADFLYRDQQVPSSFCLACKMHLAHCNAGPICHMSPDTQKHPSMLIQELRASKATAAFAEKSSCAASGNIARVHF